MDKPAWIERIISSTQARDSFMGYIEEREAVCLRKMRDNLKSDNVNASRIFASESLVWKDLRHQITMYEREEEQNGIIQEQRSGSTTG